ncbi:MAG: DUF4954 family protein [Calditrichaceae bacterium]
MREITKGKLEDISKDFVPKELRADKKDRYYFRNRQTDSHKYRALTSKEIEILVKNNNTAELWDKILVSDNFDPSLVRNCDFWGMVRIGDLSRKYLEFHKLRLPVGLNNCTIISCDIGNDVVMRNVQYLSHYIIGNNCILFNIDEMLTVDTAKFGNGIVKEGEDESVRIWLEVGNENGGRKILPFAGILPADAYLWSRFRDDSGLLHRFQEMTDQLGDTRRGYYGSIGNHCVIKNSRIIKDVNIGPHCYIKGANKLKNLTIQSSAEEPTQIGEGVELVNGIIGHGNHIFYGVKAVRFVTCRNVQVKYGARLINSFLGSNSTVSCCELLNNLIFPFHEQHHNNSFLIASTLLGQSNIAAGATIGSNHNSRAADGEILAGRGFWPGLVTNFKHNSRFASFTLVAKGNYPSEMNVTLPFSLISAADNSADVNIIPAFWFRYNMYALARNKWKFKNRDKRKVKDQHIETDFLAPDTAEEMISGMDLIRKTIEMNIGSEISVDKLLKDDTIEKELKVYHDNMVYKGKAHIIKPVSGYRLYHMMIEYYGAVELARAVDDIIHLKKGNTPVAEAVKLSYSEPEREWINIGGQLIPENDIFNIITDIKSKKILSWQDLHKKYNMAWDQYPLQRQNHGIFCLLKIHDKKMNMIDNQFIRSILENSVNTSQKLLEWVIESRKKDYTNDFRKITYRNDDEMDAVLGKFDENEFIIEMKKSVKEYESRIASMVKSLG